VLVTNPEDDIDVVLIKLEICRVALRLGSADEDAAADVLIMVATVVVVWVFCLVCIVVEDVDCGTLVI
jgi:hypothetical protein